MMAADQLSNAGSAPIIDIRREALKDTLKDDIKSQLRPAEGEAKRLPTLLVYNDIGLKLYEEITYLDEYYPVAAEIEALTNHALQIAERIPDHAVLVELGSGTLTEARNLRKVRILLDALEALRKDIDYYALDVSYDELVRTLQAVPLGTFDHVRCNGLHGTYDDGLAWLQTETVKSRPQCVMSLGSSIGNFDRASAAEFLAGYAAQLTSTDVLIVALDGCQDGAKVHRAYNDSSGVTHRFILNGLAQANKILGYEAFEVGVWSVVGRYDDQIGRHYACVVPNKDVVIDGIHIAAGEELQIEESNKYSPRQLEDLWKAAGLSCGASFGDHTGTYHINMLSTPDFVHALNPQQYAATAVPTYAEWKNLWASWDLATRKMIPEDKLLSKPIKLRNCCLFYLGHIPTFLDIHLTRCTDGKPTPPEIYRQIFERGIDPDVDNPELCHVHSEIPDEWPPLEEILQFQQDVRNRVKKVYNDLTFETNPKLRRVLNLTFEHEVMHLETFLYMLLQSDMLNPPPGPRPDFGALADDAAIQAVPNKWYTIPASTVILGREDHEDNYGAGHFFGWDNESPPRTVAVPSFEAQARPLTNGDYAKYMIAKGIDNAPASWISAIGADSGYGGSPRSPASANSSEPETDEEALAAFVQGQAVRTVYGQVPLAHALDWPVWASYDELAACAQFFGGRIPTLEEAQSIYKYAEQQRLQELTNVRAQTIPAVNGHLSNDGVHQTPPSVGSECSSGPASLSEAAAAKERNDLFADLRGANVGFTYFHPRAVTQHGNRLAGLGEMGGVWEWTSTVLGAHEGFKAMELYPGYTADFFDGKHNVVLGGSWATHPRVAGRKTFVNWFQHNYPYAWAGARLVRDP